MAANRAGRPYPDPDPSDVARDIALDELIEADRIVAVDAPSLRLHGWIARPLAN